MYIQNNKLVIVGWFKFPFGSAAASRINTLSKGLTEKGFQVSVLTTARIPYRSQDLTVNQQLSWEKINYQTTNQFENEKKALSFSQRIFNYVVATFKSWLRVYELVSNQQTDYILIYGRSFSSYFPIVIIAKLYKVPIFYDMVEWFPPSKFKGGFFNPFFYDDWLGRHLPFFCCNGVIAITTYIADKYIKHNIPSFILPSIFDYKKVTDLELVSGKNQDKKFVVLYAGTCKVGDGFENLMNAVKIAFSEGCPILLNVIGTDGLSGLALQYRNICEQDEILGSIVNFLGRVSNEQYLGTLKSADCLVLPRPDSQIVRAAFPTRLPEFLSTGRPVLTTNVPDVPLYLDNGVHAEMVSGDTSKALAEGIMRLWQDPGRALRIGKGGQKRGSEVFDYRYYMEKLSKFIMNEHIL